LPEAYNKKILIGIWDTNIFFHTIIKTMNWLGFANERVWYEPKTAALVNQNFASHQITGDQKR
jgi:hypothetical protein